MGLRRAADIRTLIWCAAMPFVVLAQYARPELVPYLSPLSFYFAMAAGTIAHNHNHVPTFEGKRANQLFAIWVSIFYGYPTFAWIPTHNLNHHKYVNKPGDATITWRHTNSNNILVAFTYYFISSYYQAGPINEYKAKAKERNPKLHRTIQQQFWTWVVINVALFFLAVGTNYYRHGNAGALQGFYAFVMASLLPSIFGTWSMMWFNYMQHVHTDPWSKYNHSRNITGRIFNFLVFNNGLHTVHHANAGTHWSDAYKEHAKIADKIDPRLNERSFWWWVIRAYVLSIFIPPLRTKQIGRAPFETPEGSRVDAADAKTDSVEALEAGANAQMV
jgi:fatty acid desaturase